MFSGEHYFLPYQQAWINDRAPLRLMEKSRQIGATFADAYDSVRKVMARNARLDVWVSSRDEQQARLYLEDCIKWAKFLNQGLGLKGFVVYVRDEDFSAHVLEFTSGRRIYSLSSNPNALAGK